MFDRHADNRLSRDAATLARVLASLRADDTLELDDMADALMAPIGRVVNALGELAAASITFGQREAAHA